MSLFILVCLLSRPFQYGLPRRLGSPCAHRLSNPPVNFFCETAIIVEIECLVAAPPMMQTNTWADVNGRPIGLKKLRREFLSVRLRKEAVAAHQVQKFFELVFLHLPNPFQVLLPELEVLL
jgi:hypothetical protein